MDYIVSKTKWGSRGHVSFPAWIPHVLHAACHISTAVFSKRHNVLFKKDNELSTLCDANFGLILYNTARKLFKFSISRFM
jgi:hypothetical protein